jgi:hypothetical protein
MEIVTDNRIIQFVPNWVPRYGRGDMMKNFEPFYDAWLSHSANSDMHGLKCSLGVRSICDNFDTQLIEIPVEFLEIETLRGERGWNSTVARDLSHPGKEWNQAVFEQFLENIV